MQFFTYPYAQLPDLSSYFLLTPNAPVLTAEDRELGIFLIDGTWRYADVMLRSVEASQPVICRSLPREAKTAYPRRQEHPHGLASVEALFLAYRILDRPTHGLLDRYYWKKEFLSSLDIS